MNAYLERTLARWKGERYVNRLVDETSDAAGHARLRESTYNRRILAGDSPERAGRFADLFAGPKPRTKDEDGHARLIETMKSRYLSEGKTPEVAEKMATLFTEG